MTTRRYFSVFGSFAFYRITNDLIILDSISTKIEITSDENFNISPSLILLEL